MVPFDSFLRPRRGGLCGRPTKGHPQKHAQRQLDDLWWGGRQPHLRHQHGERGQPYAQWQYGKLWRGVYIVTYGSSTVALQRSLFAGNIATGSGDEVRLVNFGGSFLMDDANLFGHSEVGTADALSGVSAGAADLLATSDSLTPIVLTDIFATTLANNGGPTLTHALVAGSPAIDASPADANCQATDQRGVSRP